MSKLEDALNLAAAGKRAGAAVDRAPDFAALASALQDTARAAAAEAVAKMPSPQVIVQPAPRTAWRFQVIRREGLIEEIVATPLDPKAVHG